MKGGTIVLGGGAELRTGAWMMRGTIISLKPLPLLPTFALCGDLQPDVPPHTRENSAQPGSLTPV